MEWKVVSRYGTGLLSLFKKNIYQYCNPHPPPPPPRHTYKKSHQNISAHRDFEGERKIKR
jgi:hypothetical protein